MFKKVVCFLFLFLLIPVFVQAEVIEPEFEQTQTFKAEVLEIIKEQVQERENSSWSVKQLIRLRGLSDGWEDKEVVFDGTEHDVLSAAQYQVGDKVIVNRSLGVDGEENFYIIDYARGRSLLWLLIIFSLLVILVGHWKGLRALVVLGLTFFIILKFIIPQILVGTNPVWVTIIGSVFILLFALYITEGFNKYSHIAIVSILISLVITGLCSSWFTGLAKLSGFASDEVMFLLSSSYGFIDVHGLLLAAIIIGTLGVLDDVVISQVMTVKQLKQASVNLNRLELYKRSMKVGVSHLSSMVNTLFLAYAGAALPLLLLFGIKEPPFIKFSQIISQEIIATEIVRTLAGSVGLILAVPIATLLAVAFIKKSTN